MKTTEQIAEAMFKTYCKEQRINHLFRDLGKRYKEVWLDMARVAYKEIVTPDPSIIDPTGDSLIYITVRIGQACYQQAVPRAAILEMPTPEMILGNTVIQQIKEIERRLATVKENK